MIDKERDWKEKRKKVGISSLSKKLMIQAGAGWIYALVGIHLLFFMCWN